MEIERGSTSSHSVENSLGKRLQTCRKTESRMNECNLAELGSRIWTDRGGGQLHYIVEMDRASRLRSSSFLLVFSSTRFEDKPWHSLVPKDKKSWVRRF